MNPNAPRTVCLSRCPDAYMQLSVWDSTNELPVTWENDCHKWSGSENDLIFAIAVEATWKCVCN